jgi:hypothetical protein
MADKIIVIHASLSSDRIAHIIRQEIFFLALIVLSFQIILFDLVLDNLKVAELAH